MLKTLTVWNFALLEHVEIEFGNGLNILTGETGAGKSILIDALGAVLGARLSSEAIRTGCDWLRVEAIFDIANESELHELLSEEAIDDENDDLIITRQITTKGRSAILVNGCHVTLAILKKIGEYLVDIHGQHENLALLKTENQFALLDGSDEAIQEIKNNYAIDYSETQEIRKLLESKKNAAQNSMERIDMLKWQEQEIENAKLQKGEDIELEEKIRKLSNSEKISENIGKAYDLFEGTDETDGILSMTAQAKNHIEAMSRYDKSLDESIPMIENAICELKEAFYNIRDYQETLDFDEGMLDNLQGRMETIDRLKKKYGNTLDEILSYHDKIKEEIASFENYDNDIEQIEEKLDKKQKETEKEAEKLSAARHDAAKRLENEIGKQIVALGMPDARIAFSLEDVPLTSNGKDSLTILFTANVGEEARPLSKVASGGELSRIALAIKTVAASDGSMAGSMVFDEIDTGIGGRTAQMVAERIVSVSQYKQVLCITHLPQIASMADCHFYLSKVSDGGKTSTNVSRLSGEERAREIARMASGADATEAALLNANEMIDNAEAKKKELRGLAG